MIEYYQEKNGDYLAVNRNVAYRQFESILGGAQFQARVTGAPGDPDSVYTTGVSQTYLDEECTPVDREDVPEDWREAIEEEFEPETKE